VIVGPNWRNASALAARCGSGASAIEECARIAATVAGRPATNGEPFGANDFTAHRVEVR